MKKSIVVILLWLILPIFAVIYIRSYIPPRKVYTFQKGIPEKPVVLNKKTYKAGKLEGRVLPDLYSVYLGIPDTIPVGKTLEIDFEHNLEYLWKCKNGRCNFSTTTVDVGETLIIEYKQDPEFTSFKAYRDHADEVITKVKHAIDWEKLADTMNMSTADMQLVKSIALSFDGRDMLAYALSELMPLVDGQLNVAILDFLLRNAGQGFVERIPALYDTKLSYGPYQFTDHALDSTWDKKKGASIVNDAVHASQKIPGSVAELRGDDHHRAAYMFAVYNLAVMIKGLRGQPLLKPKLAKLWKNRTEAHVDNLFLYCATAHHNPAAARRAVRAWIRSNGKKSFEACCNKKIITYAKKTRSNLKAI